MLKLWKDLEEGVIALATHKDFFWYSRVAHGSVFEYTNKRDLFIIQYSGWSGQNNLLVTRIIEKKPISFLFDGFTGEYDLLSTIEDSINGSLNDKNQESFEEVVFIRKERN